MLVAMKTHINRGGRPPPFHQHARLGVDIGRVIIAGDGPDTSFVGGTEEEALRAPAIDGAFESLARLALRLPSRIWLVSKCGNRVEARTRAWLAARRFFEVTGIAAEHLLFCRTRPEKAPICERLDIGCFVDDRYDVLESMQGIVDRRLLFGAISSPDPAIVPVAGWARAEAVILQAMEPESRGTEEERAS
jgi:hypothetical protein